MHTHKETPLSLMQEHGIKPTANRILILKALLQAGRPLAQTEIETALESVDKSIISRTLATFREHHLLHTLSGEDYVRYEVCHCAEEGEDNDRHVHFHCEVCGRTFCLEELPVPAVRLPDGFSVENVEYMAHGVCPACAGKR
ncbi:MAG: transcriptional repressor [Bacteroidales bacterium]|jgi:Fur family ferric uptake transcriptional regulator|nr:transcriptional repressor [Bacteroidales bacterium]